MGDPVGVYQEFGRPGLPLGGIYTKPADMPFPRSGCSTRKSRTSRSRWRRSGGGRHRPHGTDGDPGRRLDRPVPRPAGRRVRPPPAEGLSVGPLPRVARALSSAPMSLPRRSPVPWCTSSPCRSPSARPWRPPPTPRRGSRPSASGGCTAATPATRSTRRSTRSHRQREQLEVAWTYRTRRRAPRTTARRSSATRSWSAACSTPPRPGSRLFALDAATGRGALALRSGRGRRCRDALGVNRGVVHLGRRRRAAHLLRAGQFSSRSTPRTGKPIPDFGKRRQRGPAGGPRPRRGGLYVWSNTPGVVYRRPADPGHARATRARARRRPATSAPTTSAPGDPLALPHHPAARRAGLRDLAAGRLEDRSAGPTRGAGIALDEKRGLVFLPDRLGGLRLLGRQPPGAESLRQLPDRARCHDRQARLALPVRPPRPVGPRPAARPPNLVTVTRDGRDDRRGGAGHEVGARLRVRPRDRRAAVPDRGAAGAAVRPAGRVGLADAAAAR